MQRLLLALTVPLFATAIARADDLAAGHWAIATLSVNGSNAITNWLLKVETTDGKTTATLASANPLYKGAKLKSFTAKGDSVRVVLFNGFTEQVFNGKLSGKDANKFAGTIGSGDAVNPAWMEPTEVTELTKANLQKPAGAAGAGMAALFKLRVAKKGVADTKDLIDWAADAGQDAALYGPDWQATAELLIATSLLKQPNQAAMAVKHAEAAAKLLPAKASASRQISVLETLLLAHKAAGKGDDSKQTLDKIAKLDRALDKEYITTGLPFKPVKFAGRKAESKRVAVLELFTGAQCPPCVAADLAFDGLMQTYQPTDVVLLQYHQHIPGPDPLTNTDSEARWKYYQKAHNVRGVPTAVFNGKNAKVGGGPLQFAGKTYTGYCNTLDASLETPAACAVAVSAKRAGDRIEISAKVTGFANPGMDKKLRLVLVEEAVHYGGGNKIRIHHHVVRAMPGGIDGKAITEKDGETTATVEVPALRKSLTAYLDSFVAAKGPFPRAIRPLEMQSLRVIALVQDDESHEILQAAQTDVSEPR